MQAGRSEIAARLTSPEENNRKRVAVAYQAASIALIAIGLFWLAWLSVSGHWPLIFLNLSYVIAGVLLWRRIRTSSFYRAAALVQLFVFLVIVQICLIYDIPNAAAPRVTHLYFLSMAFLTYVTFRRLHLNATYAAVLVYLAAFVVFSSTTFSVPFATPLPDELRVIGSWLHSIFALAIMCACVYIMQTDFATRSRIGRQLAVALAEDQFELFFQPQVDQHGTIRSAEALLRWREPARGLVPPGEFIPAAEQLGLMKPIGNWVLDRACERLAAWQADPGKAGLRLAVNVSAQQFHDESFVADVRQAVERHGLDPTLLELELTESIVVDDLEGVIAKMESLRDLGIRLSLDDFGTGYSSLRYLKRMPFSQVKIDQSFVRDMLLDERDAVIVKGILQLGHELHLSVIAEGVETQEQRDFLAGLGCTEFQGYLFGRPMPEAEFSHALAAGGSGAAV